MFFIFSRENKINQFGKVTFNLLLVKLNFSGVNYFTVEKKLVPGMRYQVLSMTYQGVQ